MTIHRETVAHAPSWRAQAELAEEHDPSACLAPLLEGLAAQGRYLTRPAVRDRAGRARCNGTISSGASPGHGLG